MSGINYLTHISQANHISDITLPLFIPLKNSNHVIYSEKVLRFLPKKRLVLYGFWKDQPVVIKLFFHPKKAIKHFNRELQGYHHLKNADILVPNLIYADANMGILLYEYIPPLFKVDETLQDKSQHQHLSKWLQQIAVTLAKQHQAGILQQDLHPNNFIMSDHGAYTIDMGDMRFKSATRKTHLKYLSQFLAQLPFYDDAYWQRFYLAYLGAKHVLMDANDVKTLLDWRNHYRLQREKRILKKIFRPTSRYLKHQNFHQRWVCDKDFIQTLQPFLNNPDEVIQLGEAMKSGNTCTVIKVRLDDKDFVIKRYNMKHFWHRLKRLIQKTRAAKCWENAHRLALYGIKTPKPIAMLEHRFGLLRLTSYFVTEYLPGENLNDYAANNPTVNSDMRLFTHDMIETLKFLNSLRITHGDLKANNFMINSQNVYFTDLDSMKRHRFNTNFRRAIQKDRMRFLKNWDAYPDIQRYVKETMGDF